MSYEQEQYSDALASLHNRISFKNAGTSREERIEIMRAAADGLSRVKTAQQNDVDYLLSILPEEFDLHIYRRIEGDGEVTAMLTVDKSDCRWEAKGENLAGAIKNVLAVVAYRAAVMAQRDEATPEPEKIKRGQVGSGEPANVFGVDYPSKKAAICTLLDHPDYRDETDDTISKMVGCSRAYVKTFRGRQ